MKKIILFALVFCFAMATNAQYKKPFFHTLSVENGLPEAYIRSLLQDKFGYLWFGTQNGLVRYDGYQLKPYTVLNDDGGPVGSNIVFHLYEDRSGKLWAFFYQEGLYYLDRTKDAFVKVQVDKQFSEKLKGADFFRKWIEDKQEQHHHWLFTYYQIEDLHHIYLFDDANNTAEEYGISGKGKYYIPMNHGGADLAQDKNGKMWIIADSLLSYFDWTSRSFQPVFVLPDSTKKYMFSIITPDPVDADILWLNTWRPKEEDLSFPRKFFRFNTKTKAYRLLTPNDINPLLSVDSYKRIFSDSLKRVWINSKKSIALYNSLTGSFTNFPLNVPSSKDEIFVTSIAAEASGNLWVGGTFRGLFYLNVTNNTSTYYPVDAEAGSLPENYYVDKLFFDRAGILWVNTPYSGISYLDRPRSLLSPVPIAPSPVSKEKKINPNQYSIAEIDSDSTFFITDSSGLFSWNHRRNSFTNMALKLKDRYFDIPGILRDKDGTLWIGSATEGLIHFNPATKTFLKYLDNPKDSLSIGGNNVAPLSFDKTGTLWISIWEKGLCKFNKETGRFTHFPFIKNNFTIKANAALDDNKIVCNFLESDGTLWVGTLNGGLNRVETSTGKITSYLDYKQGLFSIFSIYVDKRQQLWAGSYASGLFLVDKKTGSFTKYTTADGLIYNSVFGIKEDNNGNIWVATIRGLSVFDPVKKKFKNYPLEIPFQTNCFYRESNGLFHLVTKKGLVSFDPALMTENSISPAVVIESISYRTAKNQDTILFTEGRKNLELKYNENRISFEYVALSFENAGTNQYAYKLDGYDENWIPAGNQRIATYTNLSPNDYTFHIKAANSDGVWNETGASFRLTILPPWWATWWFRVLSVIALVIVIYAIIQDRSKKLKAENIRLEEKVTDRTAQLKKSLEELKETQAQLIQAEKMASLGELTAGIAHEIQNPLNFVNNFSEVNTELIEELKSQKLKLKSERDENLEEELIKDIGENEKKINYHGKRADAIVKGMLQHSQKSTGQKELTDINKLANEYLKLAYHGWRGKDMSFNVTMKTDFDKSIGTLNIIPQDVGRALLNLYNNAFYALSAAADTAVSNYDPTVSVSTKKAGNKIIISVKDNGTGIPQKVVDKIFQPFFTTKPTGQGTGLGLSLAYDIVKAHGGELRVETKEREGSEFSVVLPV